MLTGWIYTPDLANQVNFQQFSTNLAHRAFWKYSKNSSIPMSYTLKDHKMKTKKYLNIKIKKVSKVNVK